MSTQDTSHSDNMPPNTPMTRVTGRNTSGKRLHGNADAPDEQPRSDNNNENSSDPESSETLGLMEAITPFFDLVQTKTAAKAGLTRINDSLARLREDVEQRVTLQDSKKVEKKIEQLEEDAKTERYVVSNIGKALDTKAASVDLDRVSETLKKQNTEIQSMQDNHKQLATFEALKHVHQAQVSRDADLKMRLETVEHFVSTMEDEKKQFATSEEVQTSIGIQNKAREDGLEELKNFMLDKIEESDQSLQEAALKAATDPLNTRLEAVEDGLNSTTNYLNDQFVSNKDSLNKQMSAVESKWKSKTHEIHGRMGTVETILENSTAEYTELKRKIEDLVSQMGVERKERVNLEKEVRGLRQDLKDAETIRQKDKEESEELVKTLRQERELEKRAHITTTAQLVKKGNELGKLEAKIAAVKDNQAKLRTKIDEDVDSRIAVYTADSNDYIAARLFTFTEAMKEYITKRTTAKDENLRKDLSRYCKDLQENDRAAEERLQGVRKDFENYTAQFEIRLTETGEALKRYGKDVTRYVDIVDPISADIYALKQELKNQHESLEDEIQEHLVQAKSYTDQSTRKVELNTSRERSIWDCIDLVKTVQVDVLETQMDESKAHQGRLAAEQSRFREELDAQKTQHGTLRKGVEEDRKGIDERHYKLAVMVHNHDSFLKKIPAYA